MTHYTVMWPRVSKVLWLMTLVAGVLLAGFVAPLRPLVADCAWVLLLMPAVSVAGMAPRYARRYEAVGQWSWRAWGYRLAGLTLTLLVYAVWLRATNTPTDQSTVAGLLAPLAHLATLGLLGLSLVAGAADQRDDDARWSAEVLRRAQEPPRMVWSGRSRL